MIYGIPKPQPGDYATAIARWSIKEVIWGDNELPTHHLIGFVLQEDAGRASTAIQSFDKEKRLIETQSGRLYQLIGEPGQDSDADYVWSAWKMRNDARDEKDVTEQYHC
jgi:hypothetical protein